MSAPASNVLLAVGDSVLVDPVVHAWLDERIARDRQELDLEVHRHGEVTLADALAATRQMGMFSADRAVWLRGYTQRAGAGTDPAAESDAFLAAAEGGVAAGSALVVSAAECDRRSKLYRWFSKHGEVVDLRPAKDKNGKIDRAALADLAARRLEAAGARKVARATIDAIALRAGNAVGEFVQEIDRLWLSLPDGAKFDADFVRGAMRDLSGAWVFDMTNALGRRDYVAARRVLVDLLDAGEAPLRMVALLGNHLAVLVDARRVAAGVDRRALGGRADAFTKGPYEDLPEAFRKRHSPFRAFFLLKESLNFGGPELLDAHRAVLDLDLALKSTTGVPAIVHFEGFLMRVCAVGRRPPRRVASR